MAASSIKRSGPGVSRSWMGTQSFVACAWAFALSGAGQLLFPAAVSAVPQINVSSPQQAVIDGEVFYTDQQVAITFSDNQPWGRGGGRGPRRAFINAPDGSEFKNCPFDENGQASFTFEIGRWADGITRRHERMFGQYTAHITETLLDGEGNPRFDENGVQLKREIAKKRIVFVRRRNPIRHALNVEPSDTFAEGATAKVRVNLGSEAFANRVERADYRLVLVQLAADVSGTVAHERAIKVPVREVGEDVFALKTETPIIAADWRAEIRLDVPPGQYELRVRDRMGWVYDRKKINVLFPNPRLTDVQVTRDQSFSDLFGEDRFSVNVRLVGVQNTKLINATPQREDFADPSLELELVSGDQTQQDWVGAAHGLEPGIYHVYGDVLSLIEGEEVDGGNLPVGIIHVGPGTNEIPTEAEVGEASQTAVDIVFPRLNTPEPSLMAIPYEAGETIKINIERAFEKRLPWQVQIKNPVVVNDGLGFDPADADGADELGDMDPPDNSVAAGEQDQIFGNWRFEPEREFVAIKLPDQPGVYDIIATQTQPADEGDLDQNSKDVYAGVRIEVISPIRARDFRLTLYQPDSSDGQSGRPTNVLWPWTKGFKFRVGVREEALTKLNGQSISLSMHRIKGTLPNGLVWTEEMGSVGSARLDPAVQQYVFSTELQDLRRYNSSYPPGRYLGQLSVAGRTVVQIPFTIRMPNLENAIRILGDAENDPTSLLIEIDPTGLHGAILDKLSVTFVRRPSRLPSGVFRNFQHRSETTPRYLELHSRHGRKQFKLFKPIDFDFAEYEVWLEGSTGHFRTDTRRVLLARAKAENSNLDLADVSPRVRNLFNLPAELDRDLNQPGRPFPPDRQFETPVSAMVTTPDPESAENEEEGYLFEIERPSIALVHGHNPVKPKPGDKVNLGYRFVNMPDLATGKIELRFSFIDPTGQEIQITTPDEICQRVEGNIFKCEVGALISGDFKEVEFEVDKFGEKGLMWSVEVRRDGAPSELWSGKVKPPSKVSLDKAIVLEDQSGAVAPGSNVFAYPYPDPRGNSDRMRTVFVVGKNLPQEVGDEFNIQSGDSNISYTLLDYPDTDNIAHKESYQRGWARVRKWLKLGADEELPAGYQALLLRARLNPGILPGETSVSVAGQTISWDLQFGGLTAQIDFARGQNPGDYELLQTIYTPERVKIRVQTSSGLPISELPILLHQVMSDGSKQTIRLTARPDFFSDVAPNGYPQIFVTRSIRLVDKGREYLTPPPQVGDIPIEVRLAARGPHRLVANIAPEFVGQSFQMPTIPQQAKAMITSSPGRHITRVHPEPSDWTFKSALKRAAIAAEKNVDNWDTISQQQSDEIVRYVLFKFFVDSRREKEVTIGHHAAMLLLRDAFVEALEDQANSFGKIVQDPVSLKAVLEAMRPRALDRDYPINRVKIKAPDGSMVEYGFWALPYDDDFLMRQFSKSAEEIARWRIDATREALNTMRASMKRLALEARAIEDKDVRGLINLTGKGFDAIKQRVIPRLMTLQETDFVGPYRRMYWGPDYNARYWVKDVAPLARAVERLDREADSENRVIAAGVALAGFPAILFAAEYPVVVATTLILDGVSLSATAAMEFHDVYKSQLELDFSNRAAPVIGYERNDEALKNAKTWLEASTSVGFQGVATYLNVLGIDSAALRIWFANGKMWARGANATRTLQLHGMNALNVSQRRHAALFALRAKTIAIQRGIQALSKTERAAIEIVENIARSSRAARSASDVPAPAAVVHSDILLSPMRPSASTTNMFNRVLTLPQELRPLVGRIGFEPIPGTNSFRMQRLESSVVSSSRHPLTTAEANTLLMDGQTFVDIGSMLRFANQLDTRQLGRVMQNHRLDVGDYEFLLGRFAGGGSFTGTFRQGQLVVKATFRQIDELGSASELIRIEMTAASRADELGQEILESFSSPHIRVLRVVRQMDFPEPTPSAIQAALDSGDPGLLNTRHIRRVSVEEYGGISARDATHSPQGLLLRRLNQAEQDAYVKGIKALNEQGIFWPETKLANFGFGSGPNPVLTPLDKGGFFRVKGPTPEARAELATRLQSYVNGPTDQIRRELRRIGGDHPSDYDDLLKDVDYAGRKFLIERYSKQIEDLNRLGIHKLSEFPYNPCAGWQLDYLGHHFPVPPTPRR